jgi:hypothetical protein
MAPQAGHSEAAACRRSWWSALLGAIRRARADALAGRARRVTLILVLVWILNVFDLIFTLLAHRLGNFRELNPMARGLLGRSDTLIACKLATVFAASVIIYAFRRHRVTEVGCWGLAGVYTVLAFLWGAYYAMIR